MNPSLPDERISILRHRPAPIGWGLVLLVCLGTSGSPVEAWSPPLNITNLPVREVGPQAATDSQGNVHLVWFGGSTPDAAEHWRIWYQMYDGSTWTAHEMLSGPNAGDCDIAVDGQDNVHVAWNQGSPGDPINIFYRKRTGATWGPVQQLSSTSGRSLRPRIAVDATGDNILVVYHQDYRPAAFWEIDAVKHTSGIWGPLEKVSQAPNNLSRNANIDIDAGGNFHIVWEDLDARHAYYRRRNAAGGYAGVVSLDGSPHRSAGPDVAVGPDGRIHFAWHEDAAGWDVNYRSLHGSTWSTAVNLSNRPGVTDCCASVAASQDNDAFVVWHDFSNIFFSRQMNGVFHPSYPLTASSNQTGPLIVFTPDNQSHVIWEIHGVTPTGTRDIMWSWRHNPSSTPPNSVTDFVVAPQANQNTISWRNPGNIDYVRTRIVWKTTSYPSGPDDGTVLVDQFYPKGSTDGVLHTGLTNGTTYHYAAFAFDDSGNASTAALASAIPAGPADLNRDGSVDMTDFGLLQACLTGSAVPQNDPDCQMAKLDDDQDVDQDDVAILLDCMSGAGIPSDPDCAPAF